MYPSPRSRDHGLTDRWLRRDYWHGPNAWSRPVRADLVESADVAVLDRAIYDLTMRSKTAKLTFTEQARRAQILAAAVEVIAGQGFPRASIAKIAEHVGIAKSVVLYHFATKDELVTAVVGDVFASAAAVMVPAVAAESTATGKLAAYIRANAAFIDGNRRDAVAMLEIVTSFRTESGLRLDQAAAESVRGQPLPADLVALDPAAILEQGMRTGEFRSLSPVFVKNALRAAIDGAVWEVGRDPGYDVLGYGEELVTLFALATRRQP